MSATLIPSHMSGVSDSVFRLSSQKEISDLDGPELFSREELQQFADEDRNVGRRIGTILSVLFVYPLVVMTVVIWWTLLTVEM